LIGPVNKRNRLVGMFYYITTEKTRYRGLPEYMIDPEYLIYFKEDAEDKGALFLIEGFYIKEERYDGTS
jgi:hypothetical protein